MFGDDNFTQLTIDENGNFTCENEGYYAFCHVYEDRIEHFFLKIVASPSITLDNDGNEIVEGDIMKGSVNISATGSNVGISYIRNEGEEEVIKSDTEDKSTVSAVLNDTGYYVVKAVDEFNNTTNEYTFSLDNTNPVLLISPPREK